MNDERLVMEQMVGLLRQVELEMDTVGFSEPEEACSYLEKCRVDVASLDVEMRKPNGIGLAKRCKELYPGVNLIFMTGYSRYMMEAFRLHASGHLMKPVGAEELQEGLHNLRHSLTEESSDKVRVQIFESLEIFPNGKPASLPRTKCRGYLVYLVGRRGARVFMPELASILWGDRPCDRKIQNSTHQVIHVLMKALKQAEVRDIIIKNRRKLVIDMEEVDCDYYAALNGDSAQMNASTRGYMTNHSWVGSTLGGLSDARFRWG